MVNYHKQTDEMLQGLSGKPRLLLHSCCAPCSSSVIERLGEYFTLTVFYDNPNIYPEAEYRRRAEEQRRLLEALSIEMVETEYDPARFDALGLTQEREGGLRCRACYEMRIRAAAQYAKEHGYEWYCTTLSVSPHKNAEWINELGEQYAKGVRWLPSDFKKKNGFLRSLQLSEQYGLYRQEWCGCRYSWQERKEK